MNSLSLYTVSSRLIRSGWLSLSQHDANSFLLWAVTILEHRLGPPLCPLLTTISHSLLSYYTLYHEPSSLSLSQQSAAYSLGHYIKNKQQPWHKPSPCLCSLSLHTIYHRAPLIQSVLVKSIPIYFFYSFTGK